MHRDTALSTPIVMYHCTVLSILLSCIMALWYLSIVMHRDTVLSTPIVMYHCTVLFILLSCIMTLSYLSYCHASWHCPIYTYCHVSLHCQIFPIVMNHYTVLSHHHQHHQSLNCEGRWGTTDDFATSFLHFPLLSTALWDLPNSRPVHSLMLSSHFFLCLPCLLPPFTVPCNMVLARPVEREPWPYHYNLRLFTIVKRSSSGPIACWILARTSSLVTGSLYEMCSILR